MKKKKLKYNKTISNKKYNNNIIHYHKYNKQIYISCILIYKMRISGETKSNERKSECYNEIYTQKKKFIIYTKQWWMLGRQKKKGEISA